MAKEEWKELVRRPVPRDGNSLTTRMACSENARLSLEDANAVLSRAHMLCGGYAGVGLARGPKPSADLRAASGRAPTGKAGARRAGANQPSPGCSSWLPSTQPEGRSGNS